MATVFDVISVTCFVGLVIAYLQFSNREPRTLVHLVLAGVVFAVTNQVGNAGFLGLATLLTIAGVTYAVLVIRSN